MADDLEVPAPDPEPSLRDSLSDAFAAGSGVVAPAGIPDPAAEMAAQTAQRARDESGRFTKPQEGAKTTPELATQAQVEPPHQEIINPPASWSATAKAQFKALDPVIQQEVLKREKDIEQGKAQWDQKGERLNRLDAVLGPRRERFQLAGLDEVQAIQALLAAQDLLDRDPIGGLATLAQRYGVNLAQLAQTAPGQAAQQPPMHPALQQLTSQVQSLQNALAQRDQSHASQIAQQYVSEVEAFRADPANMYFDNVRDEMVALLNGGRAQNLQEAYDQAVWANKETRVLVQSAQEAQRAQEVQARAKAARHAGGSINGSPAPGSSPANAGPAPTLRDELNRAFGDLQ